MHCDSLATLETGDSALQSDLRIRTPLRIRRQMYTELLQSATQRSRVSEDYFFHGRKTGALSSVSPSLLLYLILFMIAPLRVISFVGHTYVRSNKLIQLYTVYKLPLVKNSLLLHIFILFTHFALDICMNLLYNNTELISLGCSLSHFRRVFNYILTEKS
jgi:hypothetical protein